MCSIDPYGDTSFNYLQWPYLINEFNQVSNDIHGHITKISLKNLIMFVEKIPKENHTYLKFIGD